MKMKKTAALIMAAALITTSIVGCGNKQDSKKDSTTVSVEDKTENSGETKKGNGEKKVLSVTTWDNDNSPQFQATIDAFTKENPNVEIKVIDTSADEYNNSLGISLSAGDSDPDVIWVKDMGSMLQMADKKQLMPIDDFVTKDNFDKSVYSGAYEQLQYNGKSYALPYRSDWYVLYYNKDLFDAAGVPYPSNDMTWEQYYELAKKMTSGDGSSKVYGTHNHTWHGLVVNWAVQDGKNTVVQKDYSFLKKYYEDALKLQSEEIIQDYSTLKTANIHYSSVFKNQQVAMMPMGTWFIAIMMQAQAAGETDFKWGVATIPHSADTKAGYTVGALTPIVISAKTDEPDLAWEFVKFAASEETAKTLAKQGVFTGIQTEEALNIIATAENFPEGESNLEALKYNNFVFDRTLDSQIEEVKKIFDEVHEMIMIGETSVDDAIVEIKTRVGEIKGW